MEISGRITIASDKPAAACVLSNVCRCIAITALSLLVYTSICL